MKSLAKAEAQIRELKEKLQFRFAGSATIDTVRQTRDAAGWPMLLCSDGGVETAGAAVIAIRIRAQDAVSKDVFGNDLVAFTPHALELASEASAVAGQVIPASLDQIKAELECAKIGMKIQVKQIANGTAVDATSMDATAPAASLEYEVQWPTKGM